MVSEIPSHEMVKFTEIDCRLRRMEAMVKSICDSKAQAITANRTDRGTVIRVGAVKKTGARSEAFNNEQKSQKNVYTVG